jgi:hypothetical protein
MHLVEILRTIAQVALRRAASSAACHVIASIGDT